MSEYLDEEEISSELESCWGEVTIVAIVHDAAKIAFEYDARAQGFGTEQLGQRDGCSRIAVSGTARELARAVFTMSGVAGYEAP